MTAIAIKGAKAGQDKARKPSIAKDSVASTSTAKLLYGLAEGEVWGLVDGGKSIRLDGTPLLDDAGNSNFEGVTWDFRHGTNEQEYIKGFPDVSNETPINVELRSTQPWIKAFTDTQLSAVRIRFKWNRLSKTDPENGDVKGYKIDYAIDLQTDGGVYQNVLTTKIEDKASAGYERTHRIDLPKSKTGWQIRVRRITPNDDSEYVQDTMLIDAVAEVIDVKLRYPNTALLGLQYNAETFASIAKLEAHVRGSIIRVPANYDPVARTYTGIWDGTFKDAYTNNPAWIYFDLCTQWRYGLGERLDITMIDKWSLYALGQYCDQMVSDGQGGLEPRFTCNVYLQKQVDAYQVLQNIGGIFRAMSYWNGERIVLDADVPQDPVYTFSRANVIEGNFEYTGTRARDRHTLAKVAWDNPLNRFETEYEYIRDEKAMAKFGVKVLDLSAFGCTSQAQAQRAGLWALKTEQLETRQVSFGVGLDGFIPQVGNIINVSDELFAGRANGGRISAVSDGQYVVTLDRDIVANTGDVLIVNGGNGKSERRTIKTVTGRKITLNVAFTAAETENVWAIETADLKLMRFRVLSIGKSDETTFAITAIQHEPQKYDAIDFGTDVKPTDITIVNPDVVDAPASVTITSRHRVAQGQTIATLVIGWSQVSGAVAYDVEWRKDDGSWVKVPRTGNVSVEIEGVYSGQYLARVRSVSAFDVQSQPTMSMLTEVQGKIGLPPSIVGLTATGILFGMAIKWGFGTGSGDAAYTEIETGSAPGTNVKLLGQYSYPTNTHTVTGLQGNLSQSYRARLVDKLGFKSEWSPWVTGTTDASADKVLDLLEGKITESQLYQDLGTKIDKIAVNETAISKETQDRINAINQSNAAIIAERNARTEAIAQSALTQQQQLQAAADGLANDISASNNQILVERQARIDGLLAANEGINTEIEQRKSADATINSRVESVLSKTDTNAAAISSEITARTGADNALGSRIDTVTAVSNSNKSAITSEITARTNADSALGSRIDIVTARTTNNESAITSEATARTNADSALSTRVDTVTSKTNDNAAAITNVNSTLTTAISAQTTQLNYLSSEINLAYADKTKFANKQKSTAWTFAKTVAHADYTNAESIRGLSADYQQSSAKFTEQINLNVTANKAVAQQVTNLSAQIVGGYTGNDVTQITSGLLHQERQATATRLEGLAQQISLLSAGVGEQFDPFAIWHFDSSRDGWTAGTYATGWLNVRTETIASPAFSLNGNGYHHVKLRVQKKQSPTWGGLITWSGGSLALAEPTFDLNGIATIDIDVPWSGTITGFNLKLASSADNLNYYAIDWIAVGRPSPGASSAALLREEQTRASQVSALTQANVALDSKLNTQVSQLTAAITDNMRTLTTEQQSQAERITSLDSQFSNDISNLSANITDVNNTLTNALGSQAEQINIIRADYKPQYADATQYADASRSTQWTFAKTVARDNYTTNERITVLQSDVTSSNAQITQSLNTLATKDTAFASDITQLKTATGDNKALILAESSTRTDQFGSLSSQINTVQSSTATAQSTANQAVSDAQSKASAAEAAAKLYADAQAKAKADAAQAAASNDATSKANAAESAAKAAAALDAKNKADAALASAKADATTKADAAKAVATAAQTAATNAATLAGNKGEVIYQWQTPSVARQLPQNLWIDTTGGKNTPKRWDGSAWVVVTDKAAIDAQTAANNAQATATEALGKANTATTNIATIKTDLTAVTTQSSATATSVQTLQTTVGSHTASIQTSNQVLDGLKAQSTTVLDVDGYVVGTGTYNDGKTGTFAVRVDEFYIAAPGGGKSLGFIHYTTSQTINGVVVPIGTYLRDAYIANGTITSAKIGNAAITTAKIANLAVKTAQIDNLAVTTGKIANLAVDTLQIADYAVVVPRLQYTATSETWNAPRSEVEINRLTVNAMGGSVAISFGFEKLVCTNFGTSTGAAVRLRIKRGSTVLRSLDFNSKNEITSLKFISGKAEGFEYAHRLKYEYVSIPTYMDQPPTGEHVYTVTLESLATNETYVTTEITARSLHIMGVKK